MSKLFDATISTICSHCTTNFVYMQDLLMLGGGVGSSVEHRYVSKLPKIKKGVFSVLDFNKKIEEDTIEKINIIYAKDYNLILEAKILIKKLFNVQAS